MNCQEAQSNIMNYINHRLNNEQTKAFIEHTRTCPDCQDELEITYIVKVCSNWTTGRFCRWIFGKN